MGVVGDIVGAVVDRKSASRAHDRSLELQRKSQAFAQGQTAFQASREDTAIQRKTADMRAAGINPLLGAQMQGASSSAMTAGGSASGAQQPSLSPTVDLAGTAMTTARLMSDLAVNSSVVTRNLSEAGLKTAASKTVNVTGNLMQDVNDLVRSNKAAISAKSRSMDRTAENVGRWGAWTGRQFDKASAWFKRGFR